MVHSPTLANYLSSAFEKRCKKNSSYSVRAFARDLGVSSANLSRVLNGTRGFSNGTIEKIARSLALNAGENEYLKTLSESQFAKSKAVKISAREKLRFSVLNNRQINLESVKLISDWYHMAILAFLDSGRQDKGKKSIAHHLGIHEKTVEQALARLESVGAVREIGGNFFATGNLFVDPQGAPSSAVREFHHQIIKKSDAAIDLQSVECRDVSSVVFCFDKQKLSLVRERIRRFRESIEFEFGPQSGSSGTDVYALAIQFFQINKNFEN